MTGENDGGGHEEEEEDEEEENDGTGMKEKKWIRRIMSKKRTDSNKCII